MKHGFTLIELLISMAILGILATIGFGNFQSARIKAADVKSKSDLTTIAKSLEAYVNDHRSYPVSSNGRIVCNSPAICDWGEAFTDGSTIYAATLPIPSTDYIYESDGTSYTLYTRLQNDQDPDIIVINPQVICGTQECNYKITSTNIQ